MSQFHLSFFYSLSICGSILWNTIKYTAQQTLIPKFHFHEPKNLDVHSSKAILVLDNVRVQNFVRFT